MSSGAVHVTEHPGEVDGGLHRFDPHAIGSAHVVGASGGRDQRLGRHAAGPQAVTARAVPLDQRHPRPDAGCTDGGDESGGAAADHDEVSQRHVAPMVGIWANAESAARSSPES